MRGISWGAGKTRVPIHITQKDLSMFTSQQKLECIQREITQRERVYPRRVEAGKMSQHFADRQIALMRAIESDYQKLAAREKSPGLFE